MQSSILANFYKRDFDRLIEEVNLFKNEENLWNTYGSIKNSSGNLALHIIGGMNYLIGTILAQTGYVRNRDQEFIRKNVPRSTLVTQLEEISQLTSKTLEGINLEAEYPIMFDDMNVPNSYVLTQLLVHLNYHLGQVNYLRRMLE